MSPPKGSIGVIIPVYRSQQSLPILVDRLVTQLNATGRPFEIILVDDFSPDESWSVLLRLKQQHPTHLKIVRLARNGGQHNALLCGFSLSRSDILVTMDDDLQHPPEEIPKLITAIEQGYDLAIASYDLKKHEALRNTCGNLIDRIQRSIFNLPGDFQLTSFRAIRRAVVDHVNQMSVVSPYVTAMLLSHTSRVVNVPVRHEPRAFGRSNYNLRRSLVLALNLLLTYSTYPIYFVAALCLSAFVLSLAIGITVITRTLLYGTSVPGWASTVVILSFFNALILMSLVVLGLYLSRLTQQVTRSRVSYTIGELHE
jgi:dolichol-phosphate mannosyltransferase/undecaprenyl-phosphate 4-deoxy-4-formamido-L-arabinose transferase